MIMPKMTLNTADAKSSAAILSILCNEFGWTETASSQRGHIIWVVSPEVLEASLQTRKGEQRVSHVPGMHGLCRKGAFSLLAKHHAWDFAPETWILRPGETVTGDGHRRLRAALKAGALILKPDDGTQGDGIFIVRTLSELQRHVSRLVHGACVVQKYLGDPMLLGGGLKFDLRLYGLVLSLQPRRLFLCSEGLVRVCSEAYEPPEHASGTRCSKHLTNYSINKYEPGFEHNDDPSDGTRGTKRSLRPVLEGLEQAPGGGAAAWAQIRRIVHATLDGMAGCLDGTAPVDGIGASELWGPSRLGGGASLWDKVTTRFDDPSWGEWRGKSFHLLGVDVMLDASGCAHMLEVNCNPSLGVDAVFVTDGPHAVRPPDTPHPGTEALVGAAMPQMKGRGVKVCRCRSHHRPHLHRPCPIDLTVKHAAVGGALTIVSRDARAAKAGEAMSDDALVAGTRYEPLTAESTADGDDSVYAEAVPSGEVAATAEGAGDKDNATESDALQLVSAASGVAEHESVVRELSEEDALHMVHMDVM